MPTHELSPDDVFYLGDVAKPVKFQLDLSTTVTFTSTEDDDEEYMTLKTPLSYYCSLSVRGRMTSKRFKKQLMSLGMSRNNAERAVKTVQFHGGQQSYFNEWLFLLFNLIPYLSNGNQSIKLKGATITNGTV